MTEKEQRDLREANFKRRMAYYYEGVPAFKVSKVKDETSDSGVSE